MRIDFKVKIPIIASERKEELHAALLMDRVMQREIRCMDLCFTRLPPDIQRGSIIADLLRHPNAAVRLPQHAINRNRWNHAPTGFAIDLT